MQQILQTREPNDSRPVVLLAADEGRFGRLGQVMPAWCPPGIRPIVGQQIVREYIYAYAAVAPELGKMTALVLPYANTEMMNLFLSQVSQEFRDYFLIMQVDGAAWHSSKSLVIPENIRLITQPAHSPELNPVEHLSTSAQINGEPTTPLTRSVPEDIPIWVRRLFQPSSLWEEIRVHHFYNKVFDSIEAVMDNLCLGLNELMAAPEKLRSMTYFPHLRIAI